jgi:hypothetical protein
LGKILISAQGKPRRGLEEVCGLFIAQGVLSGWQSGLRQGQDYYFGSIPEMYHNLGYGICTVISELKPVPVKGLFSTSPCSNQDFLSQGV